MAQIKVAINGFGRIGRITFRAMSNNPNIDVVAVNDLTDSKTLAHLLKYDSVHGKFNGTVEEQDGAIIVNGKLLRVISERSPENLPWKDLGVDIVVESTGIFRDKKSAFGHIKAGAKKVIISAPAKGDDVKTIVLGVNEEKLTDNDVVVSNASCTTNCLAPVVKVLHEKFGLVSGLMNTIHSYTSDQCIIDAPHSDLRRARTAAVSIIPTTTGAAKAVGLVLPELNGRIDGFAMRVPTPNGSVVDFTCQLKTEVTKQMINDAMKEASENSLKGILEYTEEPIVSTDIVGNIHSSIFDAELTTVQGKESKFIKIVSWYDNEVGYSNRVSDLVEKMA